MKRAGGTVRRSNVAPGATRYAARRKPSRGVEYSASIIVARAVSRTGNTSFDRLRSTSLGRSPTSLAVGVRRRHHCGRTSARTIFSRGAGGGVRKENLYLSVLLPSRQAVTPPSRREARDAHGGDSASIIVARAVSRTGNTSFDRLRSTSLGRSPTSLAVGVRRRHHCGRTSARTIFSREAGGGTGAKAPAPKKFSR